MVESSERADGEPVRRTQVQELRERLEREDYEVDAAAVAAAILERLGRRRAAPPDGRSPG